MWLLGSGRDSDPSCGGWHCSDLPQWVYAKDAHREEKCGRQSGWEQSDSWILSLGVVTAVESELRFFKERSRTVSLLQRKQILYTGIVIYAPALALNQVTGLDRWGAVVATGVVCTFYCTLGGLKAVVWTDVFQIGIMVAGFASVIIRAVVIQGGVERILNDAYNGGRLNIWNFNPNPLQRHTFWTIVIGGTFTWTSIYGVNQSQVQRYSACKSRFQAKLSLYINLLGLWTIAVCAMFCGLSLYSRYLDCDPWTSKKVSAEDQLLPYLVLDIFQGYPGVPGLFVACAYSGTLSRTRCRGAAGLRPALAPRPSPARESQTSTVSTSHHQHRQKSPPVPGRMSFPESGFFQPGTVTGPSICLGLHMLFSIFSA